jgi:hypothetical protein
MDNIIDEEKNIAPIAIHIKKFKLKRSPTTKPNKNGITIPKNAARVADFPVRFKSEMLVSKPMMNNRKITPINASSLNSGEFKFRLNSNKVAPKRVTEEPEKYPIQQGPKMIPARISPTTPG